MSEELIVDENEIEKSYIIKVDPLININDANYFFKRVNEILNMDVRWKGYSFNYVGHLKFNEPDNTPSKETYDFIITLLDRQTKHKLLELTDSKLNDQPKKDGYGKLIDLEKTEFSYTFYSNPVVIIIDETNWKTANEKLGISKEQYEQYVIFHEIGHAIGKIHKPISDDTSKPYPIMYQATLGLPDLKRFIPYPNESDEN